MISSLRISRRFPSIAWIVLSAVAIFASQLGAAEGDAPRLGKYRILSYGAVGKPPLALGTFVLETNSTYKVFLPGDKPAGEGTYAFDAAKKSVVWKTGPYAEDKNWGGAFEVDREGKTHKIRLKRTTIGTNSTDSP